MQNESHSKSYIETTRAILQQRLHHLNERADGTIYLEPAGVHFLVVQKQETRLRFFLVNQTNPNTAIVQSEIDITDPLRLTSVFTQIMSLGLLWSPEPRSVYVAGLGGGRIPLLLHSILPQVEIDCADIDPAVVKVAQEYFGVQPDERLRIHISDGREWLAVQEKEFDLILIDVFLDKGYSPYRMATREFYQLCRQRLAPGGVLVVNQLSGDRFTPFRLRTLCEVFEHVYAYADPDQQPVAFASSAAIPEGEARRLAASAIAERYHFNFPFAEHTDNLTTDLLQVAPDFNERGIFIDREPPPGYFDSLPSFNTPFSRVAPDHPCPCGSGLPFHRCHGKPQSS